MSTTTYRLTLTRPEREEAPHGTVVRELAGLELEDAFDAADELCQTFGDPTADDPAEFSACLREGFDPAAGAWLRLTGYALELRPETERTACLAADTATGGLSPTLEALATAGAPTGELAGRRERATRRADRARKLAACGELRTADRDETPNAALLEPGSQLCGLVLDHQADHAADESYGSAHEGVQLFRARIGSYVVTASGLEGEPGSWVTVFACVTLRAAREWFQALHRADCECLSELWAEELPEGLAPATLYPAAQAALAWHQN